MSETDPQERALQWLKDTYGIRPEQVTASLYTDANFRAVLVQFGYALERIDLLESGIRSALAMLTNTAIADSSAVKIGSATAQLQALSRGSLKSLAPQ